MTGQRTYVDVASRSIQHYISRTPRLKGQRGASAWLSDATGHGQVRALLDERGLAARLGAEVNPEAGVADGVVSVRFPAGPDPEEIAWEIAEYLRGVLPAIELDGVWDTGLSYLEVYRDSLKGQRANPPLRSFPPPSEFPPLETCAECRADPAVGTVDIHQVTDRRVCLDCLRRYDDRYRRPGLARHTRLDDHGRDAGLPVYREERQIALALGRDPIRGTVQDFTDLAAQGGEGSNRNHIATMYADGNMIGAFFDRVIAHGDPALKGKISAAVSAATRSALLEATRAVADPDQRTALPVIPHVVGGDDVIVSVTADRAWSFTLVYLDEFSRRLAGTDGIPGELLKPVPPSASAGLVFAHAKFPFRRAAELAADQMRAAKKYGKGAEPAVAWLDVTRDGEHPPAGQCPWPLVDLVGLSDAVRALRTDVPPSGLAVLSGLVDAEPPELALARLRDHARRLERDTVLAPFLGSDDPAAAVQRIAGALSLARWWR